MLAFVLLWVAVGPVGMAFDGCAWMCDTPCGLTTAAISLVPRVPMVIDPVGAPSIAFQSASTAVASVQDPPPRPLSLSA
jgi:hypothetical protein